MLSGMVVYGQFDELLQHLALPGGTDGSLHVLPTLGIGQKSGKLIEYR